MSKMVATATAIFFEICFELFWVEIQIDSGMEKQIDSKLGRKYRYDLLIKNS